jgi:hypothetical protein
MNKKGKSEPTLLQNDMPLPLMRKVQKKPNNLEPEKMKSKPSGTPENFP